MSGPERSSDGSAGLVGVDLVAALPPLPPLPPRVRADVEEHLRGLDRLGRVDTPRRLRRGVRLSAAVGLAVAAGIGLVFVPGGVKEKTPAGDVARAPEESEAVLTVGEAPAPVEEAQESEPEAPTPRDRSRFRRAEQMELQSVEEAAETLHERRSVNIEGGEVLRVTHTFGPRVRPSDEAAHAAPEPAAGEPAGTLVINTMPWARVFIDGQDTQRNTPVRRLRVPAGTHSIGLRTHDGVMHTVQVTVAAGQTARIVRLL